MNNQDYNKAENAVDRTGDAIQNAATKVKWKAEEYEQRAKDYIREEREKNAEPTSQGWLDRAKENVADAWEDTKEAVESAWEKTKDWAEDVKGETKKAAVDAETEIKKATN